MFKQFLASVALAATLPLALAQSPAPANPTVRLRATIEKIDASSLTVRDLNLKLNIRVPFSRHVVGR